MKSALEQRLSDLKHLPRPIYGQTEALPNKVISYRHSHPWVQFSYAISGVLEVQTAHGRFIAPPQRAVWIPVGVKHRVHSSVHTQIRSLYIDHQVLFEPPQTCRVVEVTPLLKELIRAFGELPIEYDENSAEGRLAAVLLDQLAHAPDMGLMLPLPADKRLQKIVAQLQKHPDATDTLSQWATSTEAGFVISGINRRRHIDWELTGTLLESYQAKRARKGKELERKITQAVLTAAEIKTD